VGKSSTIGQATDDSGRSQDVRINTSTHKCLVEMQETVKYTTNFLLD